MICSELSRQEEGPGSTPQFSSEKSWGFASCEMLMAKDGMSDWSSGMPSSKYP